ncbi:MAG TPA: radical SAM protein [Acidobacteriota bacterium]|nr:radical SAM protein [Acidobacteriota bacterium]
MKPKHVLLVRPKYYSAYPPLGLLKLSAYHKKIGDTTELVYGTEEPKNGDPDIIYITSLFTWAWEPVWQSVRYYSSKFPDSELWLGGLYASLMPEHAALSGVDPERIFKGIFREAECFCPDYDLVPEWNRRSKASIVFATRGCIRACTFCGVSRIEGKLNSERTSIKDLLWPGHSKVIFFDNNFLAGKSWQNILSEVRDLDLAVDFNQGLDARLMTQKVAKEISELKIDRFLRISYDTYDVGPFVRKAIDLLESEGIDGRSILVYLLYNFTDTPEDFFARLKNVLSWGAVAYPMRFQPVYTLKKNDYVSPKWNQVQLDSVATARRLFGSGGTFPPYKGMMKVKVEKCKTFDDAFTNGIYQKEELTN